jgi:hypothetical protein
MCGVTSGGPPAGDSRMTRHFSTPHPGLKTSQPEFTPFLRGISQKFRDLNAAEKEGAVWDTVSSHIENIDIDFKGKAC